MLQSIQIISLESLHSRLGGQPTIPTSCVCAYTSTCNHHLILWGYFLSISLPFKFHFPTFPSVIVPVVVATVTVAMVIIVAIVLIVVCVRYKMRVILREDYEAMTNRVEVSLPCPQILHYHTWCTALYVVLWHGE